MLQHGTTKARPTDAAGTSLRRPLPWVSMLNQIARLPELFRPEYDSAAPDEQQDSLAPYYKDVAFNLSVLALCHRVAHTDGHANHREYQAFRRCFPIATSQESEVRHYFFSNPQDVPPTLFYVRHLACMFDRDSQPRRSLYRRLLMIALADGTPTGDELLLLQHIAHELKLPQTFCLTEQRLALTRLERHPYRAIGAERDMAPSVLRSLYHHRLKLLHPDRLHASGASRDTLDMANQALMVLQQAWKRISRQRGVR